MANFKNSDAIIIPPFDEYTRMFRLADGTDVADIEYWSWRKEFQRKQEEESFKARMEYELKCVEATQFMGDMLNGYAPSIAISRSNKRKRHGHT